MSAWLAMWSWRIQEAVTPRGPKRLHILMCPYCHGLKKYIRQQRRAS